MADFFATDGYYPSDSPLVDLVESLADGLAFSLIGYCLPGFWVEPVRLPSLCDDLRRQGIAVELKASFHFVTGSKTLRSPVQIETADYDVHVQGWRCSLGPARCVIDVCRTIKPLDRFARAWVLTSNPRALAVSLRLFRRVRQTVHQWSAPSGLGRCQPFLLSRW